MLAPLIIAIVTLALLSAVLAMVALARKKSETPGQSGDQTAGTDTPHFQKKIRTIIIIITVLIVALFIVLFVTEMKNEDANIVIFVPIWFAAMIPMIVARKHPQALQQNKKAMVAISIGLIVLVILGVVAFMLYK
ncbi:hypothetical protein ACFL0L_05155 [Patescibacteria group bacterium]